MYFKTWQYLVKLTGWPLHACSWEPYENLNPALLRYVHGYWFILNTRLQHDRLTMSESKEMIKKVLQVYVSDYF